MLLTQEYPNKAYLPVTILTMDAEDCYPRGIRGLLRSILLHERPSITLKDVEKKCFHDALRGVKVRGMYKLFELKVN